MTTQRKIFILIALAIIAGVVWFGMNRSGDNSVTGKTENNKAEAIQPVLENTVVENGVLNHSNPNFSLNYPKVYAVTSFEDAEGETLLIKNTTSGSEIQIYLSEFDEDITLTAARIKKDVPSLVMNGPMQIEIGKAVAGVYFKSSKSSLGESQEVWFVKGGYLYQISAYKTEEKVLADLVASFQFK